MKQNIIIQEHQEKGIEYLLSGSNRYLAGVQGTGKTYTALEAARRAGHKFILIICPLSAVRDAWVKSVRALYGVTPRVVGEYTMTPRHGIWITTFTWPTTAPRMMRLMQEWDCVIVDEAHKLKNPEAKATKIFLGNLVTASLARNTGGILRRAKNHWWLSGTPATNSAADFYTPFRYLFPHEVTKEGKIMTFYGWKLKYCKQSPGRGFHGVKNEKQLSAMLDRNFLRITKADAGIDGKVQYGLQELQVNIEDAGLKKAFNDLASIKSDSKFLSAFNQFEKQQIDLPNINRDFDGISPLVRLGVSKAQIALDYLVPLGEKKKVVIFCQHLAVYRYLRTSLGAKSVGIFGGVRDVDRGTIIDQFQENPNIRFFIGQLKAASEAITLTSAADLWFIETGYVPATVQQAIARIDRWGQKEDKVNIIFTVSQEKADQRVINLMLDKAKALDKVMRGSNIDVTLKGK